MCFIFLLPVLICLPLSFSAPLGRLPNLDVELPFGEILGIPDIPFGSGRGGDRAKLRLPFSGMKLPFEGILESLLPAGYPDRQIVHVRGGTKKGSSSAFNNQGNGKPMSVLSMPFAEFYMPLSSISSDRQELPAQARAQIEAASRLQAQRPSSTQTQSESDIVEFGSLSSGSRITNAETKSGAGTPVSPLFVADVAKGNLETALRLVKGPTGDLAPLENKLSLPLSIMHFPLNLLRLPLSQVMLPFSKINQMPFGSDLLNIGLPSNKEISDASEVLASNSWFGKLFRDEAAIDPVPELTHAVSESLAYSTPEIEGLSLNGFSMPYSYLNSPLGFFNLPLAYLNLPYGRTNLPLSHVNTPFSFFNMPLFEMLQSFGPSLPAVHFDEPTVSEALSMSPIDSSWLPPDPEAAALATLEQQQMEAQNQKDTEIFVNSLKELINPQKQWSSVDAGIKKPADGFELADKMIREFGSNPSSVNDDTEAAKEIMGKFSRVFRDAVPGIPNLGGLFGTPLSLFLTPFSLLNVPFSLVDMPMGFLNLPLSHFSLPLSHMTLPFGEFALPLGKVNTDEFDQTLDTATVELADVPPSLLELLNPDNLMQSYVNMPLSEMNMPLAVMDMPFSLFDMPLSFINAPFSHFNNPLTSIHLPFELSNLPFAELTEPFFELFLH